jgi:hypothetical protein
MSSGMIGVHESALSSCNTVYHEFLLTYKESRNEVYGFVEGKEDPMYYAGLIENRLPPEWSVRLVRSGNKRKVLEVFELFDWDRFDKNRICFFVDRDLSEFIGDVGFVDNNMYITDGYSIENAIATPSTLIRVVKEIYGLSDLASEEEQKIIEDYERNLSVFSDELAPIMSQIIVWRRSQSNACLDNIKMSDLFRFRDKLIEIRDGFGDIASKLAYAAGAVNETVADIGLIQEVEYEFREKKGVELYIRGKYVAWLFVEFVRIVHDNAETYCSKIRKKPKIRIPLGQGNAMTVIAPRARIPGTLASFIDRNYLDYIYGHEDGSIPQLV